MKNSTSSLEEAYMSNPKFQWYTKMRRKCYSENVTHSNIIEKDYDVNGLWCPRTFDGFMCWDDTPASTTAYQLCPGFVIGFDTKRNVLKKCDKDGNWTTHPNGTKPWTNYTTCINTEDLALRNVVNNIYIVGYSISIFLLIIAVAIFLFFRSLKCVRVTIHLNLYISFILSNSLWIVWFKTVIQRPDVLQQNSQLCQIVHSLNIYFMISNYFWMYNEASHLRQALVMVFFNASMKWCLFIGWIATLIITLTYVTVRYFVLEDGDGCWINYSHAVWIYIIPVALTLFISCICLLYALDTIIKTNRGNTSVCQNIMKTCRAAVVLVPLFGIQYLMLPFQPSPGSMLEIPYHVTSAILTSYQGAFVAILFCFTNQEVQTVIRKRIRRFIVTHENIQMCNSRAQGQTLEASAASVLTGREGLTSGENAVITVHAAVEETFV